MPKIFGPFEQAEAGKVGGLGLGLAISKTIVELHGGKISAASAGIDRGATFAIELPVFAGRSTEVTPTAAPPESGPINGETKRWRILLIDDHQDTTVAISDATWAILILPVFQPIRGRRSIT